MAVQSPSPIPSKPPAAPFETIASRLVWVMVLRVAMTSVLLGATVVFAYKWDETFWGASPKFLLVAIGATYFLTIIYGIWYRLGKAIQLLAQLQVIIDLIFWACISYATGGISSGFTFLFDLWVIVAAVLLGSRAAFVTASTSVFVLSALVIVMTQGILPPLPDQAQATLTAKETLYYLAINVVALFVVATLVNSLVARLESTGKGLEIERVKRADLSQLHGDMIRSLAVGIATTDNRGKILMMNPAGREILCIGDIEIVDSTLDNWIDLPFGPGDAHEENVLRGKTEAVKSDGTSVPMEYAIAPLLGSDGERRGSIVAFSDQSEVQQLQAEVERTRRLAALGELAASLAHEIRNPLGAVSGSFQILRDSRALGTEDKKLLEIISRELTRIERLVTDMLQYARPQDTRLESTDVCKLIDETVKVFLMGPDPVGLNVSVRLADDPDLFATLDSGQLRQVLWNLLRNAAQACAPGDRIEATARREGDRIAIEITDTGPGIEGKDVAKIFDPFFSTRKRGIGLGLALCKSIVEKHHGKIQAFPREDSGSVFRIELPADKKP